MIGRRRGAALLAFAFALGACANPITSHRPWDDYAGETLRVHGEDPATAGQLVWRSLQDQASVHDFLARQGEPDTLEIRGGKFSRKTIVLYYRRRGVSGGPRSIRLDPVKDGFTPRAPEPLAPPPAKSTTGRRTGGARKARRQPAAPPETGVNPSDGAAAPSHTPAPPPDAAAAGEAHAPTAPAHAGPNTEQRMTCPIDPLRGDCQDLCAGGKTYEWCR